MSKFGWQADLINKTTKLKHCRYSKSKELLGERPNTVADMAFSINASLSMWA